MAKLFYDKLVSLEKLERKISEVVSSSEEREELWHLVDELLHHKVIHCILDKLDKKHHKEFVIKLHSKPHSEGLLDYLAKKIKIDIEGFIKAEVKSIESEIISDIVGSKKKPVRDTK